MKPFLSRLPASAKQVATWSAIAMTIALAYAVVRYHVFGDVSLSDFPVFVLNKAVSFGGLILLAASRCHGDPVARRQLGKTGLALAALHVALSLGIWGPAYYPKLFWGDGSVNPKGVLALISGVIALVPLGYLCVASRRAGTAGAGARSLLPYFGRITLATVAVHVAAIGSQSWADPTRWPGSLPPITLLSAFVACAAICWSRQRAGARVPRPTRPRLSDSPGTC